VRGERPTDDKEEQGRQQMSRKVSEDNTDSTERVLRRSVRNRKTVVSENSSSTDSIGSEAETVVSWSGVGSEDSEVESEGDWKFGSEIVEPGSSEHGFEELSDVGSGENSLEKDIDRNKRMTSKEGSIVSTDSGRGTTPEAGL